MLNHYILLQLQTYQFHCVHFLSYFSFHSSHLLLASGVMMDNVVYVLHVGCLSRAMYKHGNQRINTMHNTVMLILYIKMDYGYNLFHSCMGAR